MIASSTYGYSWTDPGSGYPLAPVGYTYAYRYDGRGQLVTADNSLGSAWDVGVGAGNTLQYDPSGNMTRFNTGSVTRTYTYTAGTNRFSHSTERLNGYDASGRVTSIEGHAQGYQSFQIDPYWGKATRIAGEQTVAYRFGATGQRVGMTADPDGTTPHRTMYIHGLGAEPLVERRNQGPHPVTRHVYGPAGLLAIHEGPEGTVWFPLKDHLGSPRVVFSRSGTVLSWTDYYPFGGILPGRSGTSAIDHDNIKFTGYEKESEGGLDTYHAEARGYDPIDGRFITRDPMAHKYPSWSPYAYVMNNPTNLIDPTGKDVFGIYADGTITQVKNGDTDNFFYIGDDGAITHLGTYARNESGLIQLPSNFSVNENGISFSFSVKVGNENETYINPQSFASLLGAFAEVGYQDVTITRFSNSDGSSPGNSTSHKEGRNGDLRYLRSDGSGEGVTVHDGVFDDQRNTSMATALTRFGYSDIISFEKNIPMARMPIIPGTRHLNYHHDHFHLQGYRPNIQMIHYPQLFYNRP